MANNKRYFVKREKMVGEREFNNANEVKTEVKKYDFPQIFRSIPASFNLKDSLSVGFVTILYSSMVFFVLVQMAIFFPVPERVSSFSDELVTSPLSYRSHLIYLESLALKNRLEEAEIEIAFLKSASKTLSPTTDEQKEFSKLEDSITSRKIIFHTTIDEYNNLNESIKTHPDYRDLLYALGQRAYMLFDDQHTRSYLEKSVEIDPQFEQGKKVLNMIKR